MDNIRQPAVAGSFYPGAPEQLAAAVSRYLSDAATEGPAPKAIIAPHAGYLYSGPIAATAYARIVPIAGRIERVVLLGPAHFVPVPGLAAPSADAFRTPLGLVQVDTKEIRNLAADAKIMLLDAAHESEHSLEVHLPFLQTVLDHFRLIPLAVGQASAEQVEAVLDQIWGGPETLIVISSDLSHYHDLAAARILDERTADAIQDLDPDRLGPDSSCGRVAISGLLREARKRGLEVETADLRTSGDTAGPVDQVVGYGAFLFHGPAST